MKEEVNAPACGRENDLIAFLYGELERDDENAFKLHLLECGGCHTEVEGLGCVRESVVAWRDESLGGVTLPFHSAEVASRQTRPSAIAALRQFFDLSPAWLKGAVVFGSLLFCFFAVLAVARWQQPPAVQVVANGNNKTYSDKELQAVVDRRVQEELQRLRTTTVGPAPSEVAKNTSNRNSQPRPGIRNPEVALQVPKAQRPLSKTERAQLAADLRLVSARNEGDLDLVGERINE